MTPSLRKLALTAHVTFSVGWLGAVAGFLALAVAGLTSQDAPLVRAAYLGMEPTTWFVIVPLAFASLLTGLVMSLGSPWGLFRHYWVLAKLLINILATILLLLHTQPIGLLARLARETSLSGADVGRLQIQLVADAGTALLALLVATSLAVYKPRGMTPYGRKVSESIPPRPLNAPARGKTRMADQASRPDFDGETSVGPDRRSTSSTPRWVYVSGILAALLLPLFVVLHFTGRGLGGH